MVIDLSDQIQSLLLQKQAAEFVHFEAEHLTKIQLHLAGRKMTASCLPFPFNCLILCNNTKYNSIILQMLVIMQCTI